MRVKIVGSCLTAMFCLVATLAQAGPLTDGLVAYWPFDNDFDDHAPNGTVTDDAVHVPGTGGSGLTSADFKVGSGSFETSGVTGEGYAVAQFVGADVGVDPSTRDFSVAAWGKGKKRLGRGREFAPAA